MKKTQFIELFRTIKKTLVSYVAIMLFVAMGVALFTGFSWTAKAIDYSADHDYTEYSFHDLDLYFPYGMQASNVPFIKGVRGVDEAEGTYNSYPFFELNGIKRQAKATMITKKVDRLSMVVGNLPVGKDQIAVERHWALKNGVSIGDTITFEHDDDGTAYALKALYEMRVTEDSFQPTEDGMKHFFTDTFQVTALVESPVYLSIFPVSYGVSIATSTPVECIMFLPEEAFDTDAFFGYSNVVLTSNHLRKYLTSSDEYKAYNTALKRNVMNVADRLSREKSLILMDGADLLRRHGSLTEGQVKLLDTIKEYGCTAYTRDNNGGTVALSTIPDILGKLRYSMVALFVVIGLLVCYSSVSRIIHEQSVLIGTKKALGVNNAEIMLYFFLYAGSAAITGAIMGILLGRFAIEYVFLIVLFKNYMLSKTVYCVFVPDAVFIVSVELVLIFVATFIGCRRILKKSVVSLLVGNEQTLVKEKAFERTKLWKKIPNLYKAVVNNFFHDWRRVLATLIGVCGCTALVCCALTINNGISGGFTAQFDKIQSFDTLVYYNPAEETCQQRIDDVLAQKGFRYVNTYSCIGSLKTLDENSAPAYLFVFDDDADDLFGIYSLDGERHSPNEGVWVSAGFVREYGLKQGDLVHYIDARGMEVELPVWGAFEFYLMRPQIVMSSSVYEQIYGKAPENNVFVAYTNQYNTSTLEEELHLINGFTLTENYYQSSRQAFDVIASVCRAVVIIYLALSFIMAVLVLLNLFTMCVQEKKKEVLTLMINGFTRKQAKRYIYSDSILLTIFGIVIGIGLGVLIGTLSLISLMSDSTFLYLKVSAFACLGGVVVSGVLSLLMSIVALRKINKFKLTDINS